MVHQDPRNLEQLLSLHADGMLDGTQRQGLFALLDEDAGARDTYIEQMMFHAIMLHRFGGRGKFSPLGNPQVASEDLSENPISVCDFGGLHTDDIWGIAPVGDASTQAGSNGSLLDFLVNCFQTAGPFIPKGIIAVVTLLPLILLFFVMSNSAVKELPVGGLSARKQSVEKSSVNESPVEVLPVVATIMRQTDKSEWGSDVVASAGSEIPLGQRLRLLDGTVDLQMASGVRVLLEGDATLLLTGPNSLYLERGSLFAKVVPDAIGFTVQTPEADFVDLGTEFGVNVDPGKTSEAKVFVGEVNVQCELKDGEKVRVQLRKNEAARVTSGGKVESINPDTLSFTTVYPDDRVCVFDLFRLANADFSGGIWINPFTGKVTDPSQIDNKSWIFRPESAKPNTRDYRVISSLSVIDGVFTPQPDTNTLVNSAGGCFGNVGNETDNAYGYLFLGTLRNIGTKHFNSYYMNLLADALRDKNNVVNQDIAFLEMHANVGITFNLEEARQHTDRKIIKFIGTARKIEDSKKKSVPASLDVIVLADEKPIYEKRGVTFQEGEFPIHADIPEGTRFLSIIAADGHDSEGRISAVSSDHVMLYGPAFVLEEETTKDNTTN